MRNTGEDGNLQYMLLKNKLKENGNNDEDKCDQIANQGAEGYNYQNGNISSSNAHNLLNNFMFDSLLLKTSDSFSIDKSQIKRVTTGRERVLSFTQKGMNSSNIQPSTGGRNSIPIINQIKNMMENKSLTDNYQAKYQQNGRLREISALPERILDAPNLIDDYYLNLIDWSTQNTLAVSLGNSVYLWNGNTCETMQLMTAEDNICSVSWMESGNCLAIGLKQGVVELWDTIKMNPIRKMSGHEDRIGSLSWNSCLLSTGSKDTRIIDHDVRTREHIAHQLNYHSQEVCALKWSNDGPMLASGGNDNTLCIWDIRGVNSNTNTGGSIWNIIDGNGNSNTSITPKFVFNHHEAAVKALSWCPWQRNLLASGGGSKDKTIKFWNTETGSLINSIDSGSQVCSLLWNRHEKELISSHGYSKNQIAVWKYPSMNKIIELNGHMSRVLYLAMSPDGCTIVSGAGDETLRFWKINEEKKTRSESADLDFDYKSSSSKILNSYQIR